VLEQSWSIRLFLFVVIVADNIEYLQHLKLMCDMKQMPILVLSSEYNTSEKLEAIQLGADGYCFNSSKGQFGVIRIFANIESKIIC
jgi:DNA-binding NarL/FixJ family response regulator